jgi:hypothetical protein
MNWPQLLQSVITALVIAGIFAVFRLFRDIDRLQTKTEPLLEWWKKTSLDALKLATNPTSERLTELADKYIASVMGSGQISLAEKQELIDGLREVMEDKNQVAGKRQSASVSLRFIESREHLPLRRGASH